MELSPARQKLLFLVIVVVLAALGYYLVLPAQHGSSAKAADAAGSPTPSPAAVSSTTAAAAPLSTVAPGNTQSPVANGPVNIYNWLPFTEQDLSIAAATATQFSVDYDTYTYTESAATYIGKMNSLITSDLAASLENAYVAPGVKGLRTGQKQISSATASIYQLRAFAQQSLTFVVTITQHLVSNKGTSNGSNQFSVTLTGSGSNWQVYDVEPAADGNT
jgi:hypothetical protein